MPRIKFSLRTGLAAVVVLGLLVRGLVYVGSRYAEKSLLDEIRAGEGEVSWLGHRGTSTDDRLRSFNLD